MTLPRARPRRIRGRHLVAGAATTAAMVLALGSAAWGLVTPAAEGVGHRLRVLVVGDSVMEGARAALPAVLPEADLTVDAAVSRSTVAGLDVLRSHGTDWDVIVLELGTNDGGTESVFRPRVQRLLDTVNAVPHVVFLTIHEARPYYRTANDVIRGEAAAHPNVTVADWNTEASAHPEALARDGIHLTPPNVGLLAQFVAAHVRQAAGTAPTTTTAPPPATTVTTDASRPVSTTARRGANRRERLLARPARPLETGTADQAARNPGPSLVFPLLAVAALGAVLAIRRSPLRGRADRCGRGPSGPPK